MQTATPEAIFARAVDLTRHLPGAFVSTHYGKPAIKVNGKTLASLCRERGALSVHCPLELKEALVEVRSDVFYDTPHFRDWPAILVRMDAIDDERLRDRLASAWTDLTGRPA